MTSPAGVVLRGRGLSLAAAGRALLHPSDFDVQEGEIVLLVGPSGSGKSLLTDLLLGFVGPHTPGVHVTGSVTLDGSELLGAPPSARDHRMGAVFQLHTLGLFDDLTLAQNLRFGSLEAERAQEAARELGLRDLDRPASLASGGERMRLAIARSQLRGAGVRIYDEPSTGLDPRSIRQVVSAIAASHERVSLIVTHDYASFLGLAQVVLLIDPATRTLVRLTPGPATLEQLHAALEGDAQAAEPVQASSPSFRQRLVERWIKASDSAAQVLGDLPFLLTAPLALMRLGHPLDGVRLRRTVRRDLSPAVLGFVALGAFLVALTATWFLFERMPERGVAEPLLQDDLVGGLGLISMRVVVPLLTSVLLAAKLGASSAAHLGHMALTRQIDALVLLGVSPRRHLLWPTAVAQVLAAWVATTLSIGLAFLTSLWVFLILHPGWGARWFEQAYRAQLDSQDLLWLAGKTAASALAVAAVAFRVGTASKRDPAAVVRGIHRTLLLGLLLVLAVHAAFAFLEF